MKNRIEISELIYRYIKHEATVEEKKEVEEWLRDSRNRNIYNQIINENAHESISGFERDDYNRKKAVFFNHINNKRRISYKLGVYAVASVVIILVVSTFLVFTNINKSGNEYAEAGKIMESKKLPVLYSSDGTTTILAEDIAKSMNEQNGIRVNINGKKLEYNVSDTVKKVVYNTIKVPVGTDYSFKLVDGTTIYLNSKTTLRYPVPFKGKNRDVYLDGEGYFDVAKDSLRPFIVHSSKVNIKVLGTEFNVRSFSNDSVCRATLVEGSIQAINNDGKKFVIRPNQQIKISDNITKINTVNTAHYTAWKDGYFFFREESLDNILKELSEWYGFEYFYQNQEMSNLKISARIRKFTTKDKALNLIEKIGYITFRIKGKSVIVNGNK